MNGNFVRGEGFKTGGMARERLKSLIVRDRLDLGYSVMEMLRLDFSELVSNYMEIDKSAVEIQIGHGKEGGIKGLSPLLMVSIPIKNVKKMA